MHQRIESYMDNIERLGNAALKLVKGMPLAEDDVVLLDRYGVVAIKQFIEKCVREGINDPYVLGSIIVGYCAVKGGGGEDCQRLYSGVVVDDEEYGALIYYRHFAPINCIPYGADIPKLNSW
jgi:hypothetical protein